MARRAYTRGKTASQLSGNLRNYLSILIHRYPHGNKIVIYGHFIYIFEEEILLTVYQVPQAFRNGIKR